MIISLTATREGHKSYTFGGFGFIPGFPRLTIKNGIIRYLCAEHRGGPEVSVLAGEVEDFCFTDISRPIHGGGVVYGNGRGGWDLSRPMRSPPEIQIAITTSAEKYIFNDRGYLAISQKRIASQLRAEGLRSVRIEGSPQPLRPAPVVNNLEPPLRGSDAVLEIEGYWKLVQIGAMTLEEFETEKQRILKIQR